MCLCGTTLRVMEILCVAAAASVVYFLIGICQVSVAIVKCSTYKEKMLDLADAYICET